MGLSICWWRECFPAREAHCVLALVHGMSTNLRSILPCMIAFTYSQAQVIPGEILYCFARPVRATALGVPAGVASRTTLSAPLYCAHGGAVAAICDFMRGQLPSVTLLTYTAECAEIWISSAFPASMARVCSPGCFVCFVLPRTVAHRAGTVFSPCGFTGELSPSIVPSIRIRRPIRLRARGFSFATFAGRPELTFFAMTV